MTNLTRLCITAIVLLVAIPVVSSMLIDTLRFVSPIIALGLLLVIAVSVVAYGYRVIDRAVMQWRKPRTGADGRERQPYRPEAPGQ